MSEEPAGTGVRVVPFRERGKLALTLGAGQTPVARPARDGELFGSMDASRRESFEREALPHLDAVYRVALRLTSDAPQAEDLTQETMLRAYRSWHTFHAGSNARAWLLTILRNTFINEYRKARRAGVTIDVDTIEGFTVFRDIQDSDPEGTFFDQLVDDEVVRAVDALPDEFREALVLSDVEGMSYAEIAKITGVPIGTVKSRIFRARQALQRELYRYAVEMGYIRKRKAAE